MSDSAEIIHALYAAMDARDGHGMAALYHPGARFRDPLFDLHGDEIGAMWRMLTGRARDLRATVADVRVAADGRALAHWRADYTFGSTGRTVVNEVKAAYRFAEDGRIADHVDSFDLKHWATQALGGQGRLLMALPGGAGILRRRTGRQLAEYMGSSRL